MIEVDKIIRKKNNVPYETSQNQPKRKKSQKHTKDYI